MKTILSSRRDRYLAILAIFLVMVALIAGMVGCTGQQEEEEEEEQCIVDWNDLNAIRNNLDGDYFLANNLDSNTDGYDGLASPTANGGRGWEPIGTSASADRFTGTFDGGGYSITGLYISRPDEDDIGLFGYVEGGIIENVGLVEVDVTGGNHTGALVGYNDRGTVGSDPVLPYSTYSTGSVTGSDTVGGLIGCNWDGTLSVSQSSAHIAHAAGECWRAGGLVGANWGNVLLCIYSGEVAGDHEVGGMVGLNGGLVPLAPTGHVITCQGEYTVTGNWFVGGEVGTNLGDVDSAIFKGEVNGALWKATSHIALNEGTAGSSDSSDTAPQGSYVGGLVGRNKGSISNSFAVGDVSGAEYIGGAVGYMDSGGTLDGCFAVATVEGTEHFGPVAGENNGTVTNSASVTAEQMMDITTLEEAGWEICAVAPGEVNTACTWNMAPGDYPFLSSIAANLPPTEEEEEISIPFKNPDTFIEMTIGDVESLDPAWGWDTASGEQVQYIYETLLFYDGEKTDQFVPVLASEWTASEDGKRIRFKIRRGVKFHNGGTLTPEDVEYSIERVMVQDRVGGPAWMFFQPLLGAWSSDEVTFADIDNAVEIDGDWVVFHLADPAWGLAFLQILCSPWASIIDKEWCVVNGEWPGTEATWMDFNDPESGTSYLWGKANGTGPWMLEDWDPGIQIKLLRFDDYWREPAPFERVITQIVEEWTTRKAALLAGDADLVYVPRANLQELDGIAGLNVYRDLPQLSIDTFLFNFNIGSESDFIGSGGLDENGIPTDFFTDEDVRKGFCYAFDYDAYISDALLGEGQQVGSPIVEGLPFYNSGASTYSLDLAKAEEHLRAAWGGQVWEKGFELTLLYNAGSTLRNTACEILAQNLAAINPKFHVDILEMDWSTYLDKILHTRDVPMFQMSWIVDYPHPDDIVVPFMDSYGFFAQVQGYGYPELDLLIEGAFKELDPAVQEDLYYEVQERYYEDAPGIVLCQPLGRRYFTEHIKGFYFNPMIPGQPGPLYYMSKSP